MSEFVNTLDVLDDDVVIDSIINKTITEFSDDIITSIGSYAFVNCSRLTKVDLPNVVDISGNNVFNGCGSLQTINLPRAQGTISVRFFESCYSLTSINIPGATSVDANALSSCSNLTSINLPNIVSVAIYGFYQCSKLESLNFPKLLNIKASAFGNCTKLVTLVLGSSSLCTLENINAFTNTPIAKGTGYIYVPRALVNTYKAATNWVTFADSIRAIEDYPDITGGN